MNLSFGIQPFWFWNGEMKDDEIARQIKEMADKGIKGFFIHPRQGLAVPYLSEAWFNKVNVAVEQGKKYGMEIWLYDEYPYPSGVSGGQVILDHPEFEAKMLKHRKFNISGPEKVKLDLPWGQIVMARAYPFNNKEVDWNQYVDLSPHIGTGYSEQIFQMSGLTRYNRKRFFTGNPVKRLCWQAPKGEWHIFVAVQAAVDHFKYFGKYVDPLNPQAVRYYIQTTHEEYRKHFGHEFGKAIKGIFTDEITAFPLNLPWSPVLPGLFGERNGYYLIDKLPDLFERMGSDTDRVRYDYWNTSTRAFVESYEIQVGGWCRRNNLLYVGEKPIMRSSQLQYFHIPGIDAGHQKVGTVPDIASPNYRANAKLAASAAHFYGKPGVLCECFHSIGWGMTLQDMKWTFDWLALQGINWFVPHAFFYTTDGLTKHDAPPSSFYQMPYWKYAGVLADYVDNVTQILSRGKRRVDILVLDPISSQWTAMGEKQHLKDKVQEDFSQLQRTLIENHLDYYVIDPELLGQSQVAGKCIKVGDEQFKILILPPLLNIEDCALEKIQQYIKNGGILIGTGCLPVEQIGSAEGLSEMFGGWFGVDADQVYNMYIDEGSSGEYIAPIQKRNGNAFFAEDVEGVAEIVEGLIERDISIGENGVEQGDILAAHYQTSDGSYYLLINTSGIGRKVDIKLTSGGVKSPELYYSDFTAEDVYYPIDFRQDGEVLSFSLYFSPHQSYMLSVRESKHKETAQAMPCVTRHRLDISGDWEFSLDGMNALRLGKWWLSIDGSLSEELVECQPIIDQVADSSTLLPVRLKDYFGCPKEIGFPPLGCRYRTNFKVDTNIIDTGLPIFLVMEPGSIGGKWYILVNGHRINPEDFIEQPIYLPTNRAVGISSYLNNGVNKISVWTDTKHTYDGLINPLYICGHFGVYRDEDMWKLTTLGKMVRIDNLSQSGLPFYAGTVILKKKIYFDMSGRHDIYKLYIQEPYLQDAVKLFVNGQCAGVKAWSPYEWCINKAWLKPGENQVELHLTTTLLGLFEGQRFDYQGHCYTDID